MSASLIRSATGSYYRVDMDVLRERLDEIDDGSMASELTDMVTARLRYLADQIDSDVIAFREHGNGVAQRVHGEAQRQDRVVSERVTLPVMHRSRSGVRVFGGVLSVVLSRVRECVLGHQGSPSVGAADVPPSAVSDPIVGEAPGAPASQVVAVPGAPSGSAS